MIANCTRVIAFVLILLSYLIPGTVAGMESHAVPGADIGTHVVEIPLTGTIESTQPAAPPPPTETSLNIQANEAVYVDQENPDTNMNSGVNGAYLRVGTTPEFGGKYWTLLEFRCRWASQGGQLPDNAQIKRVQLKIYKASGAAGDVNLFPFYGSFDENTATWRNKPIVDDNAIGSASIPATNGWCLLNLSATWVHQRITLYHGQIGVVLRPNWTISAKSIAFHSDEHPSLKPVLVIYYQSSQESSTTPSPAQPSSPTPPSRDTTPCNLTYTVTPPNPRPGQQVTITATATDNEAMYYLVIMRGSTELTRRDAATGERELRVSYTETAQLPSLSYQIFADDLSPSASPVSRTVTVPVTGSGAAPTLTVNAEWLTVERVIPEEYRLINNDQQQVRITVAASDPDGIRDLHIFINGEDNHFTFTGQTSVVRQVLWTNNTPGLTRFYYYAQARDLEGRTTTSEVTSYRIAQPQDIRIMWHEAPTFQNFDLRSLGGDLSWDRMCQAFGDDECWHVESWGWRSSYADALWSYLVRDIAAEGLCFGFSTMVNELYARRIAASQLEPGTTGGAWQLSANNSYTREWIEARQAGQVSGEVAVPAAERCGLEGQELRGMDAQELLSLVEPRMSTTRLGVICILEGGSLLDWRNIEGHAVVPWMVRHMTDGTVRVYVYDPNRETGVHNAAADFNNFEQYPFVEIQGSNWSFLFGSEPRTVWDDVIFYVTYEEACGDMGQPITDPAVCPDSGRRLYLTDHDLPNAVDCIFAILGGSADAYFEDEQGNVTGIYKGRLRKEIPGSAFLAPLMGGSFADHEMYILPAGRKLSVHAVGTADGEYGLHLMVQNTLYGIRNKRIVTGVEDLLSFEPREKTLGYRLRIRPGVGDSNFLVMIAATFEGVVRALNRESIDREYMMENVAATENSDFAVFVEEGGDALIVESYGDDIQFDAVTRSTESADTLDPNRDHGYIPASVEEDITLERGRRAEISPDNWATGEQRGKLHTIKKRARGDGAGFPLIPVIIGVVVIAVVGSTLGILFGKGVLGKKATTRK